jgi:ubiquinone/menaquinone biosynthesis C-methylase UbiE
LSSKAQVDELFTKTVDDWARFYADPKPKTLNSQNLVSRRRFALEMLEARVAHGSKILDVGCGTGHLAGELLQRGYDAWGVDMSDAMVSYARQHYAPERFQVGDIEKIPFPDNTFDAIMCLGVMEYLRNDEPALREMWRVLTDGGKAIITTPSSICPFYYMDRAMEKFRYVIRPLIRVMCPQDRRQHGSNVLPKVFHRRYYRPRWFELLRQAGFEPEDWACHCWGWYGLERFWNQGAFCRASDRFARNRLINWLASNQLVCVRAIK